MSSRLRHVALAAVSASALIGFVGIAHANTVDIIGGTTLSTDPNTPAVLYGTDQGQNNVINAPGVLATGSGLNDPNGPNKAGTSWMLGATAQTTLTNYDVYWFYAGSESGYTITFNAGGGTVTHTETDQNNNNWNLSQRLAGYQYVGMTTGASSTIDFGFTWNTWGGSPQSLTNGGGSGSSGSSLVLSYLNSAFYQNPVLGPGFFQADLSSTNDGSGWFAFGLNDAQQIDDNHDDYVGFALVQEHGRAPPPAATPIPAALPLFGSVLGGGFMVGRWRKRKNNKKVA